MHLLPFYRVEINLEVTKYDLYCYYYYTTNFLNCQGDILLTINHRFARNLHSGYAGGEDAVTVRLLGCHSLLVIWFSSLTCTVLRVHFVHVHSIVCVVVQFLLYGLAQ